MQYTLLMAHSGWRHLVLLLLFITCIKLLWGWTQKKPWQALDGQLVLITDRAILLQFFMGLVLYIISQSWATAPAWFHAGHLVPTLAGVFMSAKANGWAKRGKSDAEKFQWAFIGLVSSSVLILIGVVFILLAR